MNSMKNMHNIHEADSSEMVGLVTAMLPVQAMILMMLWKYPQELTDLDWRLVCFVVPYMFLLAILKNRASHHRKLYRRQMPDKDFEISKRLRAYLSELFCFRAKMSPVYHPVYSDALMVCFYATVWILFPQPIATAYLWIGFALPLIHEAIAICCGTRFMNENTNLIYNGRRYKCIHSGLHCATIQNETQDFLYYPIADLCGLIPSENSQ
jgi:hypothetical protein